MTRFDLKIAIKLACMSLGRNQRLPEKASLAEHRRFLAFLRQEQIARGIIPTQVERIGK
jgi:hypothetical protein